VSRYCHVSFELSIQICDDTSTNFISTGNCRNSCSILDGLLDCYLCDVAEQTRYRRNRCSTENIWFVLLVDDILDGNVVDEHMMYLDKLGYLY
jgi:hypothetical protein